MKYIDQMYWSTYNEVKNYAKVVEYSDKYIAESDPKADVAAAGAGAVHALRGVRVCLQSESGGPDDQLDQGQGCRAGRAGRAQ